MIMEYNEILEILAPCGLNCVKCLAYKHGEIKAVSGRLITLLGSFDLYAQRFSSFQTVFKGYPQFKELLEHFSKADCSGCRSGTCRYPGCIVLECTLGKGVDFCFQCNEFPCDKITFDPDLKRRWMEMNERMKDVGLKAYYEETKDLSRYR
jgi:hypothetical protein